MENTTLNSQIYKIINSRLNRPTFKDTHISAATLKRALIKKDINRSLFLPDGTNVQQWLDDFYSEFVALYFNSYHYSEIYGNNNLQHRINEFYTLIETVYLPKHIQVTEVSNIGENYTLEEISPKYNEFNIRNTVYKKYNLRYYKITCHINNGELDNGCNILFESNCNFYDIDMPSSEDGGSFYVRHRLYNDDGFRRLNPDIADTLLYTMSAHPKARDALEPDVVEEIASYAKP